MCGGARVWDTAGTLSLAELARHAVKSENTVQKRCASLGSAKKSAYGIGKEWFWPTRICSERRMCRPGVSEMCFPSLS